MQKAEAFLSMMIYVQTDGEKFLKLSCHEVELSIKRPSFTNGQQVTELAQAQISF